MTEIADDIRPSLAHVQAGWAIYSRDGRYLGVVLGADTDRFLLPRPDARDGRLEFAIKVVSDEDPGAMRARISLDEGEVSDRHPYIEPIPRRGSD